jgi:hypothetical protein
MRRLLILLLALAPAACSGSQRASDADWSPDPQPKDKRLRETEALYAGGVEPIDDKRLAQLGVRHDLMLSPTPHEAVCNCLAVEVGSGKESKFFWLGSPADTGADSLAVAIGTRGVSCQGGPADDRQRRPSISAVDMDGDDVIIEVEDLREGPPLASGVIIPKPGPKGGIYIRPHKNNRVYGRGVGNARCKVR